MTAAPRTTLYSPQMLALAVELANIPLDPHAPFLGEARSRTCGSTLALSCAIDASGTICAIGMKVSACAVGQAAAAIFAKGAVGRDRGELLTAERSIAAWLSGKGNIPDWPRLGMLEPALPHKGRHEAILLPWRAALDALSKDAASG